MLVESRLVIAPNLMQLRFIDGVEFIGNKQRLVVYRQAHSRTMSKTTEFFTAVESGNTERVRALLTADPALAKVRDDEGATAMHYATENGHRAIASFLQEMGADINARDDRFGATPRGWAIEYLRG